MQVKKKKKQHCVEINRTLLQTKCALRAANLQLRIQANHLILQLRKQTSSPSKMPQTPTPVCLYCTKYLKCTSVRHSQIKFHIQQ